VGRKSFCFVFDKKKVLQKEKLFKLGVLLTGDTLCNIELKTKNREKVKHITVYSRHETELKERKIIKKYKINFTYNLIDKET
jgi:hypothetical protein